MTTTIEITHTEALKLARAKWGDTAYAMRVYTDGGFASVGADRKERGRGWTWREACERAGLLPQ